MHNDLQGMLQRKMGIVGLRENFNRNQEFNVGRTIIAPSTQCSEGGSLRFGQTPHSNLYLSPGHALYLRGLLIPVKDLVNGRSIVAGQHASAFTLDYYHIELEDHDVVLAEGAPAETFGGVSRDGFDNAEKYERLYGSTIVPKRTFAPVVSLNGGRQELRSRLRSAISPIYDAREPLDIASRAELRIAG